MKIKNKNLSTWKILFALLLGSIFGAIFHEYKELQDLSILSIFSSIGEIFNRMIRMIIIPIMMSNLIISVSSIDNVKKLSKIGMKTILYFEIVTIIAVLVGVIFTNVFCPGRESDFTSLIDKEYYKNYKQINNKLNIGDSLIKIFLSFFPSNIFYSISNGETFSIIFFSILFGIGISFLQTNEKKIIFLFFRAISNVMLNIIEIIMRIAPVGVFSITISSIAKIGIIQLISLVKLILLFYFSAIFFVLIILGGIARIFRFRILTLIKILKEDLFLSFSTASSECVLSNIIKKVQNYGASKAITKFVILFGYSFNLDGSTLYQSIVIIFFIQLYHFKISINQEIILIITMLITSKGVTGIPGMSLITLLSILENFGFPTNGIVFIAGIDRIFDMARSSINVLGNALAALVISKLENQYDPLKKIQYEKYFRKN